MLGIFIGIAAVVSLISLGQGLQTAVSGQFSALAIDKLTIQNSGTGFGPPGSTAVEKLNEHDLKIIRGINGVKYAIPTLVRIAKIEYNKVAQFKYLSDVPEDPEIYQIVYDSNGLVAEKGRLLKQGDKGKVVIGSNTATKDQFDKEIEVGNRINIQGKEFEVVGILKKTGSFMFNDIVFMFNDEMKDLLNINDEIDVITVKIENPDEIEQVAQRIEKALRKDRNLKEGEEDFTVQTPLESLSTVNSILNSVNLVIIGIAMISLVVGGVGIANTMYASVLERKKEIGTMKAVGARNSDILYIFLIESGFLGLIGGVIGAFIGIAISLIVIYAANSYFGSQIIACNISIPLVIGAISFSFLIGVLSGLIPSYQASKLKPVDALRG